MIIDMVDKITLSLLLCHEHGLNKEGKHADDVNKACHNSTCSTMVLQWATSSQK